MFVIKYKSIFIGISIALVAISIAFFAAFGLKMGIDFTGGTTIEISYVRETAAQTLDLNSVRALGVDAFKTGTSSYKFITALSYDEISSPLQEVLSQGGKEAYFETQVNTVGPSLGKEMTRKALIAIVIVVLAILAFIAFSFREVSRPVSSWKYGVSAMVTMVHDIIIPTGVYVLLSHFYGAEVNTLFVIGLLTVMAVTISDKIVVFDRIRENLKTKKGTFDEIVGMSLKQTAVRSINTSLTTVLALVALYFFGPESTKFFALTLIVGMIVGTYSSICVASPLLTFFNRKK